MRRLLASWLVLGLVSTATAADLRHFEDAPLHAVHFVDATEGWAVGDEGVIWHTFDAGQTWERQPTGVRSSLRAIQFLTPFLGYAVGREELPQGGGSVGIILMTQDGGVEWRRISGHSLPGLHCIRFFDEKTGMVAGDGSDAVPSGVFTTADGGKTWKPVAGPRCPGWLGLDATSPQAAALAGAWTRLAILREGKLHAAEVDWLGGRALHAIRVMGQQAVAVGQGGLVLLSASTAGQRWGPANLQLPTEVLAALDFRAVSVRGNEIWAVGRPGSVILHSSDQGQNWELLKTGQNLPLNCVHFVNAKKGWAVGELGLILATEDGGQTWKKLREGGQRAAILVVQAGAANLPLEIPAILGGEEGYLTTALRVTCADAASAPSGKASDLYRLEAAMRQTGGAAAEVLWHFPVPSHVTPDRTIVSHWNRLHADRASEELLRQLVLAIRVWQPAVVVMEWNPGEPQAMESLIAETLQEALARAADAKAFPEQIALLGLTAFQVAKVYERTAEPANASVMFDLTTDRARLDGTAKDLVDSAATLIQQDAAAAPNQSNYRYVSGGLANAASHRHMMEGLNLAQGGTARRKLGPLPERDPDFDKAQKARRNLDTLTQSPLAGLAKPDQILAQLAPQLDSLPPEMGASAAFNIATRFAQSGQWELAREAFLLMVDRYPAHPLSANAYRWLIRHNSSSEARRRHEMGQFLMLTTSELRQADTKPQEGAWVRGGPESVQEQRLRLLGSRQEVRKWFQGALEIEPRLAGFGPRFADEPDIQFCLQATRRNLGQFDQARDWYTRMLAKGGEGPWQEAAAAELWLTNRTNNPPRPVSICRKTETRPFLDGVLDDPCWQGVQPMKLRNATGETAKEYPTEAWLAYDNEYLYLALRCRHPEGKQVEPAKVRRRDEDLRAYDRVSLLLDLDRDYSTYFHLQVDQRGCLFDECWGDKSWNPRWFVATRTEATGWQIEAAIPLMELTGDGVTPGKAWACNLVRVLPGQGVQAWSLPAGVEPRPEGLGLLLFMQERQPNGAVAPSLTRMPPAQGDNDTP